MDEYCRVEGIDDFSCRVILKMLDGDLVFRLERMRLKGHNLQTVCYVTFGDDERTFMAHLDALSTSNVESFRRRLEKFFGIPKVKWEAVVNEVTSRAYRYLTENIQTHRATQVSAERMAESRYLIKPLLPTEGATILFGPGGAGKGYFTLYFCCCLAAGLDFLGFKTEPLEQDETILYIDWEDTRDAFDRRVSLIAAGLGVPVPSNFCWVSGGGASLIDRADSLVKLGKQLKTRLVVVDSAVPAVGGDPIKPELVAEFFGVCTRMAVPFWVIAHETKIANDDYPFGSIFWHNLARSTINIRSEEEASGLSLSLKNMKRNDDKKFAPLGFSLNWNHNSIELTHTTLNGSPFLESRQPILDRIEMALKAKPHQTIEDLAVYLSERAIVVKNALYSARGKERFMQHSTVKANGRGRPAVTWTFRTLRIIAQPEE